MGLVGAACEPGLVPVPAQRQRVPSASVRVLASIAGRRAPLFDSHLRNSRSLDAHAGRARPSASRASSGPAESLATEARQRAR
eukprot:868946-Alexandrium_andersonii.AAC.1